MSCKAFFHSTRNSLCLFYNLTDCSHRAFLTLFSSGSMRVFVSVILSANCTVLSNKSCFNPCLSSPSLPFISSFKFSVFFSLYTDLILLSIVHYLVLILLFVYLYCYLFIFVIILNYLIPTISLLFQFC